ncbi:MAG TPA: group I intron-associated PD-(D/E)XK endonuclease [Mycobacterium sp.]|nr:group I intron-associated PD-(D/E)XK endonuclease [Mycobacterium sp.]
MRHYSDTQLIDAVQSSRSWRGVLRALGLAGTSAAAMRSVRAHADRLKLDYSHFTGQRRWTDQELAAAIKSSSTWTQVAEALGLVGGSSMTTIRGHALRLDLDTAHLSSLRKPSVPDREMRPQLAYLARAGSLMAAAWFEVCGYHVSWPLEPCRYDLLVWMGTSAERIQVKTTTVKQARTWTVWISNTGKARATYDPDEIDQFFVIDGDFNFYLIPVAAVGGLMAIQLSAYADYLLPREAPTAAAAGRARSNPPRR